MAGLLDFAMYDDPDSVGRLAFGAGLLNAAGPQTMPVSVGQALASGLMGAQRSSTEAAMNQRRNRLTDIQMQQARMQLEEFIRQRNQPPSPKFQTVGDNLLRISPDGNEVTPVFQGAPKPPTKTELAKLVEEMNALPPNHPMRRIYEQAIKKHTEFAPPVNVSVGLQAPYAGVDAQGRPIVLQPPSKAGGAPQILTDPRTGEPIQPPKPPTENKPMNDTQANASLYAMRMDEADKIISGLTGNYDPIKLAARQSAGEGIAGLAANAMLLGPNEQKADQAQRDFINAVLRRESGAVISPSEFANARQQYFPQPGDSKEVIAQKAANRRTAISGIRAAAGPRSPVNAGVEQQQPVEPRGGGGSSWTPEVDALRKKHGL